MKRTICRILSVIMLAVTAFLIYCTITVTGSGFLDLSNIVRYVLTGMAIISGAIALMLARIGWKR
ncbi:MAG: hypothetical protein HFF70_00385 [Oscillospiraceae bacterium]|jgi:hypothetical protein|nr:hypothetical protein [Oscillospiraceae bacterium]